jgi:3-phosphoshikimate 1-carboxyvinyltransferase
MKLTIHPTEVFGKVAAPPSKSMTQRAIAAGLLSEGLTRIINPSVCNDSLAALQMASDLGAFTEKKASEWLIKPGHKPRQKELQCGESGLAMRMFAPIASLSDEFVTFSGKGSLNKRPVTMIADALLQLGIDFRSHQGHLPFDLKGPLQGGHAAIDGSISSQLLTGLLMALPLARMDSTLDVIHLKSKPYIEMTLQLLADFGIEIQHQNLEKFFIKGNQKYIARVYTVEGDWSNAAFLMVAGAIGGQIEVSGLKKNSCQADKQILSALTQAGANLKLLENTILVSKNKLIAFQFDATDSPDLFPPLAVLAANCKGISLLSGVDRLAHKESNRAFSIKQSLELMGIKVRVQGNEMMIEGGTIHGANIDPFNDHRIAMMATVAALCSSSEITLMDAECVNKSYPDFYLTMKAAGAAIEQLHTP